MQVGENVAVYVVITARIDDSDSIAIRFFGRGEAVFFNAEVGDSVKINSIV